MNWWWAVLIALVLIEVGLVYRAVSADGSEAILIPIIFVGVAIFIYGGALTVRSVSRHYDASACHSFSVQANRKVKFVDYTYWSWDCLTPTGGGKWISTHNLREFGEQP